MEISTLVGCYKNTIAISRMHQVFFYQSLVCCLMQQELTSQFGVAIDTIGHTPYDRLWICKACTLYIHMRVS